MTKPLEMFGCNRISFYIWKTTSQFSEEIDQIAFKINNAASLVSFYQLEGQEVSGTSNISKRETIFVRNRQVRKFCNSFTFYAKLGHLNNNLSSSHYLQSHAPLLL